MKISNFKKGFTLIEIMVVVAIIGVLAGIIITNIDVVRRSRDAQRKSDFRKIQTALEQYKADVGSYPLTVLGNKVPSNCGSSFGNDAFGSTPPCAIIYLTKIPQDPSNGTNWFNAGNYSYQSGDGNTYQLTACIENTKDQDRNVLSIKCPSVFSGPGRYYLLTNP
ncbi:MAG: prepilin-type N-terminal cleavage/methylation domain-containing protein [Candidatus Levybacteria bacterium]|nr:prepilin-type N-terminal cleavage/methylation domain-containing protein [Candidatus Levybacteria bacterium]